MIVGLGRTARPLDLVLARAFLPKTPLVALTAFALARCAAPSARVEPRVAPEPSEPREPSARSGPETRGPRPTAPPNAAQQGPPEPPGSLPPVEPLAEILDAVPLTVEHVGRTGRYIVACVARDDTNRDGKLAAHVGPAAELEGDELLPVLATGKRPLEPIEDLLAYDPRGRFLALRRGGKPLLVDVIARSEVDLSSLDFDDRDDRVPLAGHRAAAFDPRGELFAYVRRRAGRSNVVLRTLGTGAERVVAGLAGEPWRLRWDGTGRSLVVWSVTEDTTQNGRLDWPVGPAKGPRLRCTGPVPRFHVAPETGDRPTPFVVNRASGAARAVPDLVTPLGSELLVRSADGAVALAGPGGRRPLASADCGARVLHADPGRGLVLVACAGGKNPIKAPVELLGAGYRFELGVEVQPTAVDRWPEGPVRLVPVYPGSDALLVDLERRAARRLAPGDQAILTSGPRALIRRGRRLVFVDVQAGTEQALALDAPKLAAIVSAPPLVAVGPLVFDVERQTLLGRAAERPLALTPYGEVLVAQGGPPSAEQPARGPLVWQVARP